MVALVPLSCLQDREFSSFAKTFWEKPKNHLGLSQNSKEFWNPHSIPRFTIDQSPHFSIDFFFCRCPGWAELFESTEPRTGYIFGCLECGLWCTCHRSSNPGPLDRPKRPKRHWFRKAGFDQRKKKMGASGELLPPILCCKKYHTWENELRLGNQH